MEANIDAHRTPTVTSLFIALLILVIGGGLVGITVGLIGSLLYLAIVFPIGMGFAGGMIAGSAARASRVCHTGQLYLLFVLTALVVYGSFHYGRYIFFQLASWQALASSEKIQSSGVEIDLSTAKILTDYGLRKETGHSGFLGYMLYRAREGFSVGRVYSGNRLALSGGLAWLYWAAEFGLILWIMNIMLKDYRSVPVCDGCGRRLGREQHLGGSSPANEPLVLELLGRHDLAGLGELLVKDAGLPSVELYLRKCEACGQGTSVVTVRRARQGAKGVVLTDLSQASLPPQEGRRILQQLRFEGE